MKKVIPAILFSLTILIVLALIAGVIFSIIDLHSSYTQIIASPGYSGADLLGMIFGAAAVAFFTLCVSVIVAILSLINAKIAENRFIKIFSTITAALMCIISFLSLFCLGGVRL